MPRHSLRYAIMPAPTIRRYYAAACRRYAAAHAALIRILVTLDDYAADYVLRRCR